MAVVVGGSRLKAEVRSTATQEIADGHETDSRGVPGSMLSGDDHEPPP
jgi:hypothetical protein